MYTQGFWPKSLNKTKGTIRIWNLYCTVSMYFVHEKYEETTYNSHICIKSSLCVTTKVFNFVGNAVCIPILGMWNLCVTLISSNNTKHSSTELLHCLLPIQMPQEIFECFVVWRRKFQQCCWECLNLLVFTGYLWVTDMECLIRTTDNQSTQDLQLNTYSWWFLINNNYYYYWRAGDNTMLREMLGQKNAFGVFCCLLFKKRNKRKQ